MIVLKFKEFSGIINPAKDLVSFVNDNNISKENILSITQALNSLSHTNYAIFYYADSETKEVTKGFFG